MRVRSRLRSAARASSARLRSVTSVATPMTPETSPVLALSGEYHISKIRESTSLTALNSSPASARSMSCWITGEFEGVVAGELVGVAFFVAAAVDVGAGVCEHGGEAPLALFEHLHFAFGYVHLDFLPI